MLIPKRKKIGKSINPEKCNKTAFSTLKKNCFKLLYGKTALKWSFTKNNQIIWKNWFMPSKTAIRDVSPFLSRRMRERPRCCLMCWSRDRNVPRSERFALPVPVKVYTLHHYQPLCRPFFLPSVHHSLLFLCIFFCFHFFFKPLSLFGPK